MLFDIRKVYGRYELFVDGVFYDAYDSVTDAANAIEKIKKEKNQNGSI